MAATTLLHAPLTTKQNETLRAIDMLQREMGYSPTVREIQQSMFATSTSNVHARLTVLREKGLVTWVDGQSRTLVITKSGRRAL